jgi:uncharacterized membrane protein YphA (DoxX/SURF4 family)
MALLKCGESIEPESVPLPKEIVMKVLRLMFALALIVAGVLLLLDRPLSAQTMHPLGNPAPAQVLTRITVIDAGRAVKPDAAIEAFLK